MNDDGFRLFLSICPPFIFVARPSERIFSIPSILLCLHLSLFPLIVQQVSVRTTMRPVVVVVVEEGVVVVVLVVEDVEVVLMILLKLCDMFYAIILSEIH